MSRTPWAKPQSSFPSDRLKPVYRQQPAQTRPKSKGGSPQPVPPKSKAVLELESLVNGLKKAEEEKDKDGGCFCQAREHDLSEYTPLCRSCGLVLCSLNLPCNLCPSCSSILLQQPAITNLITKLETRIITQLAKEERERAMQAERIRQAIGAFPTLTGAPPPTLPPTQQSQTHKVISLNPKTKKVIVTNYTPPPSKPQTPEHDPILDEEKPIRVPRPPEGVIFAQVNWDPKRPWADLRQGTQKLRYMPAPKAPREENTVKSEKRKNKGGNGKGRERVVPGSLAYNESNQASTSASH